MTMVTQYQNGKQVKRINKNQFYIFCHEYLNIIDPTELWLDVVEYGSTCDLYWNGNTFRFVKG